MIPAALEGRLQGMALLSGTGDNENHMGLGGSSPTRARQRPKELFIHGLSGGNENHGFEWELTNKGAPETENALFIDLVEAMRTIWV